MAFAKVVRSTWFTCPTVVHCSNAMAECRTIRFVAVPQQMGSFPGKGLGHLAREPVLRGIWDDLKVINQSAVEAGHDVGRRNAAAAGRRFLAPITSRCLPHWKPKADQVRANDRHSRVSARFDGFSVIGLGQGAARNLPSVVQDRSE